MAIQSIISSDNTKLVLTASKKNNFNVILNQNDTINLYGHTVTPFDAIVMRGIMPDNNIASLALLKSIGGQLAFLERLEAEDAKKANPDDPSIELYYQSLPPHMALTRQVDKAINAHTARLLQVMGKVEQVRSSTMTSRDRQALITQCNQVFEESINYIKQLKESHQASRSPTASNNSLKIPSSALRAPSPHVWGEGKIVETRCDDMISELETCQRNFQHDPIFVDDDRPIDTKAHQRVFRTVLRHYESLEGTVSAWEGVTLNRSCTEAYQDASLALQNHIYSIQAPNDVQLWQLPKTGKVALDTQLYGEQFERDKLLFTLSAGDLKPLEAFEANKREIHQRQKDDAKEEAILRVDEGLEETSDDILGDFKENLQDGINAYKAEHRESSIDEQAMCDILNKAFNQSNSDHIYIVGSPKPLYLHKTCDLYSTIGHALEEMSSHFSHEMAAKHPGLTFAFFSFTAATFGASALMATNTLTHFASQYLQIVGEVFHKASGGKLSAAAVQNALLVVEKNWISFTHADTLAKSIFMNVIVLPKLTFMMSELLLSNRLDKKTLSKIVEQFQKDELLYESNEKKMSDMLLQAVVISLGLGLTAASGLLLNYIMSLPIIQQGSSGMHFPFEKFNFLPDILPETFTSIATEQNVFFEIIAIVSVVFSLKVKDLACDKILEVGQKIFKKNEVPELLVHTEMLDALYRLYLDDRLNFGRIKIAMEEIEKVRPGTWKTIQDSSNKLRKEIPASVEFIKEASFWDALNDIALSELVEPTKKVERSSLAATALKRFRQAIDVTGRAMLWIVGPPIGTMYTLVLNPILTLFAWSLFRIMGKPRTLKQVYFDDPFTAEMFYQAAKLGRAVSGVFNFVSNMLKVVGNSSYRAVFLGLKIIATGIAFTALCSNAIIHGQIRQGIGAFLAKIGSVISRGVLRIASGIVRSVFGSVRGLLIGAMAVAPSIVSIGLLPFAMGGVGFGIASAVRAVRKSKPILDAFKEGYLSMFHDGKSKQLSDFVVRGFLFIQNKTAFITQVSHAIFEPMDTLRQALHSREDRVENDLLANVGATTIMSVRDRVLSGLNTVQARGKNGIGEGINVLRTLFVRSVETEIQRHGSNVKDGAQDVTLRNTQSSAAFIHSMIGSPKLRVEENVKGVVKVEEKQVPPPVAPTTDGLSSTSSRSHTPR